MENEESKKESKRGSVPRNFVYAKPGFVANESFAVVQEGYEHEFSIIPKDSFELDREVVIKDNASVAGEVYGSRVLVGKNCEMQGIVFSKSDIVIDSGTHLFGHVIAGLSIECGEDLISNQDLVAQKVKIGARAMVFGSIFAEESVEIGAGSVVRGLVCCPEGSVSVGNDCVIYDIMARRNIVMGTGVAVEDEVVSSDEGKILFLQDPNSRHPLKDQVRMFRLNVNDATPEPVCVMKRGNGDEINVLATPMYHFRNMETGKTPIHETAFELREKREKQLYESLPAIQESKKKIDGHRLVECPNCGAAGTTSLVAPYHYHCTSCRTDVYDSSLHEEARRIYEFLKTGTVTKTPVTRQAATITPTKAKAAARYTEPASSPVVPTKIKVAVPEVTSSMPEPVAPVKVQISEPEPGPEPGLPKPIPPPRLQFTGAEPAPSGPEPVAPPRMQFTELEPEAEPEAAPVTPVKIAATPVKIKVATPTIISSGTEEMEPEAGPARPAGGSMAELKAYIKKEIPDLPEDQLAYVVKRYLALKTPDRQRAFILMMKRGEKVEEKQDDGLDFVDLK
nr:hypothetical protein [Candidatus Sigynarchaeum springense]